MDDVVNRFARELADAIAAAVAENPQVEACREKARAAGFEMKLTLEAVVGFVSRPQGGALAKVTSPARAAGTAGAAGVNGRMGGNCGPASFSTSRISVCTIFTGARGPNSAPRAVNAAIGTRNLIEAASQSACRIAA